MSLNLRYHLFHEHPHLIYNALLFATGLFAVTSPTITPVVIHLTILLLYSPILVHRRHTARNSSLLWLTLSFSKCICWAVPAWHTLSTPATSLFVLFITSVLTSMVPLIVIFLNSKLNSHTKSASPALFLFPALWAAAWYAVSVASPIGRLTAWTPVANLGAYEWLMPLTGPIVNDWIAAAWAAVLFEAMGHLLMGQGDEEEQPLLVDHTNPPTKHESASRKPTALVLLAALVLLTIPSFFIINTPLHVISPTTTPLTVGCILPPRPEQRGLTFKDYMTETSHLWASSDILLWPEGAVQFDSREARDATFAEVAGALKKYSKALIGVSFIDTHEKRNGIAFISRDSDEPQLIYYKRHLVPVVESYPLKHSSTPPEIFTYELSVKRGRQPRPVPISTSICLDLAFPNPFTDLKGKPTLILAPARTWDRSIGHSMWQQVRQRALELDSMVLWCDGGAEGLSGVAGKGMSEATHIGTGSWTRVIGVPYPSDGGKTLYGRTGDALPLAIFFGFCGLGYFWGMFKKLKGVDYEKLNPIAYISRRQLRVPEQDLLGGFE